VTGCIAGEGDVGVGPRYRPTPDVVGLAGDEGVEGWNRQARRGVVGRRKSLLDEPDFTFTLVPAGRQVLKVVGPRNERATEPHEPPSLILLCHQLPPWLVMGSGWAFV
jgi:hypothetical protein